MLVVVLSEGMGKACAKGTPLTHNLGWSLLLADPRCRVKLYSRFYTPDTLNLLRRLLPHPATYLVPHPATYLVP